MPIVETEVPAFACDAMLRGVARWLRVAGYDASWTYGIEDDRLVREADSDGRVLLTSDARLMERRVIRLGQPRAVFVPRDLTPVEGTRFVLTELGLTVRTPPRCMKCGGSLQAVEKESARQEIPPKTWLWIDEYFRCGRCRQLFWRGTHWGRIEAMLTALE